MRFQSYFNTAIKIIKLYDGAIPLSYFLKKYFSENKKHGSKDRKLITHACYNYYRPGKALKDFNAQERLKTAIFLCNEKAGAWNILYNKKWLDAWNESLSERIKFIKNEFPSFKEEDIFPFTPALSSEVEQDLFSKSHLIQPDVFLRVRIQADYKKITTRLQQHKIAFKETEENCIAVINTTKIDDIINIDKEAVIQDYSSQQIKSFLETIKAETLDQSFVSNVWDCCAGSGGKSILAYDVLKNIQLTATDIRVSIIQNLKKRFATAGIKNYKSFVLNAANPETRINAVYDLIICDAPCTGSGTWGRTPEHLFFFKEEKIKNYSATQTKIISNTIAHLKPGGYFLYITCSVFTAENENIIQHATTTFNLTIVKKQLLKGYDKKADTLFAALLKK